MRLRDRKWGWEAKIFQVRTSRTSGQTPLSKFLNPPLYSGTFVQNFK